MNVICQKLFRTLKWYRSSILLKNTWINITTLLQYASELYIHGSRERDNWSYQYTFINEIAQYQDFPETLVLLSNNCYSMNSSSINVTQESMQIVVVKREDAGRRNCSLHHIWRAISVVILSNIEVLTDTARGETI